jgi:hypothetical protein
MYSEGVAAARLGVLIEFECDLNSCVNSEANDWRGLSFILWLPPGRLGKNPDNDSEPLDSLISSVETK